MAGNLETILRRFADELRDHFRAEMQDQVLAALGSKAPRKSGRAASSGRSGRRSAEDIAKQAQRILKVIKDNPGSRSEQIATATGLSTGDLVAPLKKLLADKAVAKKGVARGTTYTVKA